MSIGGIRWVKIWIKLNTNEKRNELSSLLVKLDQLINQLGIQNNVSFQLPGVKNYDSNNQVFQTEDEMLLFFYDDIWKIKSKILELLIKNGYVEELGYFVKNV